MKSLFFVTMIFFMGIVAVKADDAADSDFLSLLDQVKNPFAADLPKPVVPVVPLQLSGPQEAPKPVKHEKVPEPVIKLPPLKLKGVVVGQDMRQAIIDDQLVAVKETIDGVEVVDVTKEGVALLFKGKKFFLKIEE